MPLPVYFQHRRTQANLNYELPVIDVDIHNTSTTGIMLVDIPVQMPPFSSTPSLNNLEEFLNTKLFSSASTSVTATISPGPSGSTSSPASSLSFSGQSDILLTSQSYLDGVGYISPLKWTSLNKNRPLPAIRTELVLTQSENLALSRSRGPEKALLAGCGAGTLESASTLPTASAATSPFLRFCGSDTNLNAAAALSLDALNPSPPAPFPEPNAEELALQATVTSSTSAPILSALGRQRHFAGWVQWDLNGNRQGHTPVHAVWMSDLQFGGPAGIGKTSLSIGH
ncbi:hypothetical protein GYMLUDRAFT_246099 [Collybiopsis luxurians FD-317 M1]|uniref:Uncharacterized protein n=1 Tax=Collybiopsis luxurians FD-317 M1 TaxID=944289 RepID=A0A0D0CRW6_9AGAR|nr:hypothetical protein GYMLUDRAFT_246099 [Collybiopsis luxurians FD-317 M1]